MTYFGLPQGDTKAKRQKKSIIKHKKKIERQEKFKQFKHDVKVDFIKSVENIKNAFSKNKKGE